MIPEAQTFVSTGGWKTEPGSSRSSILLLPGHGGGSVQHGALGHDSSPAASTILRTWVHETLFPPVRAAMTSLAFVLLQGLVQRFWPASGAQSQGSGSLVPQTGSVKPRFSVCLPQYLSPRPQRCPHSWQYSSAEASLAQSPVPLAPFGVPPRVSDVLPASTIVTL